MTTAWDPKQVFVEPTWTVMEGKSMSPLLSSPVLSVALETPRRLQGGTQGARKHSRDTQEAPRSLPADTHEAPRGHPEHPRLQRHLRQKNVNSSQLKRDSFIHSSTLRRGFEGRCHQGMLHVQGEMLPGRLPAAGPSERAQQIGRGQPRRRPRR